MTICHSILWILEHITSKPPTQWTPSMDDYTFNGKPITLVQQQQCLSKIPFAESEIYAIANSLKSGEMSRSDPSRRQFLELANNLALLQVNHWPDLPQSQFA